MTAIFAVSDARATGALDTAATPEPAASATAMTAAAPRSAARRSGSSAAGAAGTAPWTSRVSTMRRIHRRAGSSTQWNSAIAASTATMISPTTTILATDLGITMVYWATTQFQIVCTGS